MSNRHLGFSLDTLSQKVYLLFMKNISDQAWFNESETVSFRSIFNIEGADKARFVGGCVRNSLMGLPISDIDVATTMCPEDVKKLFEFYGYTVIPTGLQHGTVTVMIEKVPFEVTTLRKDVDTDGRWATVEYVDDWATDAQRRDFTINALYADFEGNVHDFTDGLEDIDQGRVRFVGNAEKRIEEDALRILRFFRFSAKYSNTWLDREGLRACAKLSDNLMGISAERISNEMLKLLDAKKCRHVLRDMELYGILPKVIPNFTDLNLVHGFYYQEFNSDLPEPDALLRLRAMLPNNPEAILETSKALRLTLKQRKRLLNSVITDGKMVVDWSEKSVRKGVYKLGKEAFRDQFLLIWAGHHAKRARKSVLEYVEAWDIPILPINGDHLIDLGLKPGREVGKFLSIIENAWVESDFQTPAEELIKLIDVPMKGKI